MGAANVVQAPLAYRARPHNGIWATPPYLHNGFRSKYLGERLKILYLGSKQYDPKCLGLNTDWLKRATDFNAKSPGNSNTGHKFNDGPPGNGRTVASFPTKNEWRSSSISKPCKFCAIAGTILVAANEPKDSTNCGGYPKRQARLLLPGGWFLEER
jgi:hypothetical protein